VNLETPQKQPSQQHQQQQEIDTTSSQHQKPKNLLEDIKTLLKQDSDESGTQKDTQSQLPDLNTNNVPRPQTIPGTSTGERIQREANQQTSDAVFPIHFRSLFKTKFDRSHCVVRIYWIN
jgi:hypothetical protein